MFEENFVALNVSKTCEQEYCMSRIIWALWDSDDVPEDVREMISVTRTSLVNFTFCFLTHKNVSKILDFSSFPKNYPKYTVNRKSDVLNLRLLEKYGGIYIDASTYINSGQEMEWFFAEAVKTRAQAIGFQYVDGFGIPANFWGFSENSSLIKLIKEAYDFALRNPDEYVGYVCSILSGKGIKLDPSSCTNTYDLLAHTVNMIMHDNDMYNKSVVLLPANRSHYYIYSRCKHCIYNPVVRNAYPFVKVFSGRRRFASKTDKSKTAIKGEKRKHTDT